MALAKKVGSPALIKALIGLLFCSANLTTALAADDFSDPSAAPAEIGRVSSVVRKTKHVVVQFPSGGFDEGDSMTVTSEEGPSCEGSIIKKSGNRGVLDLSSCADFSSMAAGQHVNINKAAVSHVERSSGRSSGFLNQLRFGAGIYYSFGSAVDFNNATFNGNSTTVTDYTSGEPGLKASVGWMPAQNWGLDLALAYEFSRTINTSTVAGQSTNVSSLGQKFALVNFELGGHLSFGHIYIPAALLVDIPMASGQLGWGSASPGVGVQGGVGYQFDKHWEIEALYKLESFTVPSTTIVLVNYNYGTGYMYNFQLGANYWF